MNMTIDEPNMSIRSVSTSNLIGFSPNRRADTMTLALALRGDEGFVVLAADRLQTLNYEVGNYTQDTDKLVEINKNCAFACAGPSTSVVLLKRVMEECSGNNYASIETTLHPLLREKFHECYTTDIDQAKHSTSFLLVMIDDDGEFAISTLQSHRFLPSIETNFRAIGSGAQSTYFLNRIYADRKPTLEQALLLACFCINETAKQDRFVGDGMDIWVLRQDTLIEKLTSQQLKEIRLKAESISASIIQQFLGQTKGSHESG